MVRIVSTAQLADSGCPIYDHSLDGIGYAEEFPPEPQLKRRSNRGKKVIEFLPEQEPDVVREVFDLGVPMEDT
jgi:hypothetical protein